MKDEQLKTGTTTVGLVCSDGIVLGADRRATTGNYIAIKHTDKVLQVADNMVLTIAGSVSDAQLLVKLIKAELQLKNLKTHRDSTVKEAANLLCGMVYRNIRIPSMLPGVSHFLLGGKDKEGFHLYDVYADGSLTEIKDFVCSGSGSVIAWGVLELMYKPDMNIEEAKSLVAKSINSALQRDSASGGGITIFTITEKGVEKVVDKEVNSDVTL
jgi:proteasome beta subunit